MGWETWLLTISAPSNQNLLMMEAGVGSERARGGNTKSATAVCADLSGRLSRVVHAHDLQSDAGITVVTLATGSRADIPAAPVHGQDPAAADFAHGFTIAVCCTAEISLHRDKHSIGIIEKQFKMKRVALYSIGLHISKL